MSRTDQIARRVYSLLDSVSQQLPHTSELRNARTTLSLCRRELRSLFEDGRDRQLRILVVDDDEFALKAVVWCLRRAGFKVEPCFGPRYLPEQCDYDLVVTDVHMPKSDGAERVCRWVAGSNPDVPVVIHSGGLLGEEDTRRLLGINNHSKFRAKDVQTLPQAVRDFHQLAVASSPPRLSHHQGRPEV